MPAEISDDLLVTHPTWVKVQSTKYQKGSFVLHKWDDMHPEFAQLDDILTISGHVLFIMNVYLTDFFDNHYNTFILNNRPYNRIAVLQDNLVYFHVLHPRQLFGH